jgi:hypothetical protein
LSHRSSSPGGARSIPGALRMSRRPAFGVL